MVESSTIVPREPSSQGSALRRYSLFWEYEMRLKPYVIFPVSDSMKNKSDRPAWLVSRVMWWLCKQLVWQLTLAGLFLVVFENLRQSRAERGSGQYCDGTQCWNLVSSLPEIE